MTEPRREHLEPEGTHVVHKPEEHNGWSYCEGCGRLTRFKNLQRRVIRHPTRRAATTDIWLGRVCAERLAEPAP